MSRTLPAAPPGAAIGLAAMAPAALADMLDAALAQLDAHELLLAAAQLAQTLDVLRAEIALHEHWQPTDAASQQVH